MCSSLSLALVESRDIQGDLTPRARVTSAGRCPRCARCRRSSPCRGPPWHLRAMVDSYTEWSRTGALTTWSSNSQNNFLTRSASSCRSLPPSNVVASYSGFGGASLAPWGWTAKYGSTKNPNFRGIYPAAAESSGRRLRRVPCCAGSGRDPGLQDGGDAFQGARW